MANPSVSEWEDMMSDTVTLFAWTGRSVSNAPTYAPTAYLTDCPCRIEMMNHLVVDSKGNEILAKGQVIMATVTIPGVKDLIVLPSDYVPVSPPILAVDVIPDDTGSHHVTIHIG